MTTKLANWFGLDTSEVGEIEEVGSRLKTVSEFLDAIVKKVPEVTKEIAKHADPKQYPVLTKALDQVLPWAAEVGAALPPIAFLAKLLEKVSKETKPEALGLLACSLAYQRSIEIAIRTLAQTSPEPFCTFDGNLDQRIDEFCDQFSQSELATEATFRWFSVNQPLAHPYAATSRRVVEFYARMMFRNSVTERRVVTMVEQNFPMTLKSILSDGSLKTKFEPFTNLLTLGTDEERLLRAIERHSDYQQWLFERHQVFNTEPFSLQDIYVRPDCGKLLWRQIRDGVRAAKLEDRIDPFVESQKCGGRLPLLEEVLKLLASKESLDAIVIQGVAGAGKSSFTLDLCRELRSRGLTPIRIRFRDLPIDLSLFEGISQAILRNSEKPGGVEGPEFTMGQVSLSPALLAGSVDFEGIRICPYVFIFDGWDEISVTARDGFKIRVEKLLQEVRNYLLEGRYTAPVRVILTGRPSIDVNESSFLRPQTQILTVRPFSPAQLSVFSTKIFAMFRLAARIGEAQDPAAHNLEDYADSVTKDLIDQYKPEFEQSLQETKPGASSMSGSLAMMGLPLLAHLGLRLIIAERTTLQDVIQNPTALYRKLIDITCPCAGNPANQDAEDVRPLTGSVLRDLLRRTAAAMTIRGRETISYKELEARLPKRGELDQLIKGATRDNPLADLLIAFFFKSGNRELGCEFVHKSFREYLFAEAVVEALKRYGTNTDQVPQRMPYWRDFQSGDPRHALRLELGTLLGSQYLTSEVCGHLEELLEWEIMRAALPPQRPEQERSTDVLVLDGWIRVRDGLADLWEWWSEGVNMRPQPRFSEDTGALSYSDFLATTLVKTFARRDLPDNQLPTPIRVTTVDSHLGDGLFRIAALVHYCVAADTGWLKPRTDSERFSPGMLWQGCSEPGDRCSSYQVVVRRADGEWVLFAPSSDDPRYIGFAAHRINGAGWRPHGNFPKGVDMRGVYLRCGELTSPSVRNANGRRTRWCHANLENFFGPHSVYWGDDFTEVYGPGAEFWSTISISANFCGAELANANFAGANLEYTDFTSASLVKANLTGVRAPNANFTRAIFQATDFRGSYLKQAVFDGADRTNADLRFTHGTDG